MNIYMNAFKRGREYVYVCSVCVLLLSFFFLCFFLFVLFFAFVCLSISRLSLFATLCVCGWRWLCDVCVPHTVSVCMRSSLLVVFLTPVVFPCSRGYPYSFLSMWVVGATLNSNSSAEDDYQVVQLNLVARGFTVLALDPIGEGERWQYPEVGDLTSPTTQHEYLARQLQLNGVSAMAFWLWDEMIALDYLESLNYVDANLLGAVGCSGGGTQTAYVGAMDDRVKAASMACYMSTFAIDRAWAPGGKSDGEQSWAHGVFMGLDKPDLLEVRAPKATQVLVTADDSCFPAQGGRDAVAEARHGFAALGAASNLSLTQGVYHHGYMLTTRMALYEFMCGTIGVDRTNANCSSGVELAVPEFSDRDLTVTTTGQVQTDPAVLSKSVHNFTAEMSHVHLATVAQLRKDNASAFLASVTSQAALLIGFRAPAQVPSAFAPWFLGSEVWRYSNVSRREKFVLAGEGQCGVVMTASFPQDPSCSSISPCPAIMLLDTQPTSPDSISPLVELLASAGYVVLEVDLCGLGEVGPAFSTPPNTKPDGQLSQACEDMATETGRSIPGLHAADILRAVAFVADRLPYVHALVATVVLDQLHTAALHAVLMGQGIPLGSLVLVQPLATLASAALSRFYNPSYYFSWIFGILPRYDLPDVMAALAALGNRILVLGPVDALLDVLPVSQATKDFRFPSSIFASLQRGADFRVVPGWTYSGEAQLASDTVDWIKATT